MITVSEFDDEDLDNSLRLASEGIQALHLNDKDGELSESSFPGKMEEEMCSSAATLDSTRSSTLSVSLPRHSSMKLETTPRPRERNREGRREVSFSHISVREYSQTISNHPSCSYGPPVQLGWDYEETRTEEDVDTYEKERSKVRRPALKYLVLNYYQRCHIIKQAGYTDKDIKQAERSVNKTKRQREMTKVFKPLYKGRELFMRGKKNKKSGKGDG